MISCPACGRPNRDGSRFCNGCGRRLAESGSSCPRCGRRNASDAEYCDDCGAALSRQASGSSSTPQPKASGRGKGRERAAQAAAQVEESATGRAGADLASDGGTPERDEPSPGADGLEEASDDLGAWEAAPVEPGLDSGAASPDRQSERGPRARASAGGAAARSGRAAVEAPPAEAHPSAKAAWASRPTRMAVPRADGDVVLARSLEDGRPRMAPPPAPEPLPDAGRAFRSIVAPEVAPARPKAQSFHFPTRLLGLALALALLVVAVVSYGDRVPDVSTWAVDSFNRLQESAIEWTQSQPTPPVPIQPTQTTGGGASTREGGPRR